ncbi:MAG: hypothetical protein LBC74_06615 [Planctomycetaceae bacterium]|jgi:hypothetical protein|nr:hypothetical protein [Planctomycetaceae bacterium]
MKLTNLFCLLRSDKGDLCNEVFYTVTKYYEKIEEDKKIEENIKNRKEQNLFLKCFNIIKKIIATENFVDIELEKCCIIVP